MKRFLSGLSVRIWLPFAFSLTLGMAFLAVYYPYQQSKLLREGAEKNLDEISRVLALSIELSLEHLNFEGLSKSITVAKSSHEFEFVALIQQDSLTGRETVFASNPLNFNAAAILKPDSLKYIYRQMPIQSKSFDGYVLIAASSEKLEEEVMRLNRPVYTILLIVLLISLFAFLLFARHLSKPVTMLTAAASELRTGNYSIAISDKSGAAEIVDLSKALAQLRDALIKAKEQNDNFNRQLEEEIVIRTNDLNLTRQRLLEAQEVAEIGNYEIDLESGVWLASETIYSIFNMSADYPLTENSWKLLLQHDNLVRVQKLFENAEVSGDSFHQDIRIKAGISNETERWISISGRAVANENLGSAKIIRGTIQNITERKRIENEVRRLSLVAEKTSNCVIITDTNRRIVWVNESAVNLTGYSRSEIIGQWPSMFQFEKTSAETRNYIREKLDKLEEVNTEILNRGKAGNEYWLDINIVPIFDEENVHIGFMAVEIDITERVKFEQELKKSEANFRSILENSSEMIHTIDNKGCLVWANRSWKEKLGLAGQQIEGLELMKFLDEKTLEEFQRVIPALSNGEIIPDLDCVFLSTEGRALNLEGRAIPVYENDAIIGSQAYLHDITSIRKAENDLKQLLELTQQQNNRLRNFTHIVSHNLRSHSANLTGLIKLMGQEWPEFNANIYFENFQTAVNNLSDVILNLSEVALIQSEDDKPMQSVSLKHSVQKAIATVFGLAENAHVEIQFNTDQDWLVWADMGYVDSIILNLLTNAIKYKSDQRKPTVIISLQKTDDFIRLDVKDNGLGIDLERQGRKIFGMYKTFHKHPDARGVGLFLIKNQVEALGGRIDVASKVDAGTVFSVFLPAVKENQE
jgi:PAS domain S-box-containing protein